MKYAVERIGVLFVLMFSVTAAAEQTEYVCAVGSGAQEKNRIVTIEYPQFPARTPCQVVYDKSDEGEAPRVLWEARSQAGFCEGKAEALVGKLSNGGFRCRRVSRAFADQQGGETNTPVKAAPPPPPVPPVAPPRPEAARQVTSLEQAAGVKKTPDAVAPAPPRRAQTSRPVSKGRPHSRVDSYLHWLEKQALAGNRDAAKELEAVREKGLAAFYDDWSRIFSLLDLDNTHRPAWSVESVACEQPGCRTWLLEEEKGRDPKGYYRLNSMGMLNGRVAEVVSCVAFDEVSKCVDGQTPAPIASYRLNSGSEGNYFVYEKQSGRYALIYACSESMNAAKQWTHAISVFQGNEQTPPLTGKGDCKSRILREYWKAL